MKAIFAFGGPGSGKGTHWRALAQHFNILHISAGDVLRKELTDPKSKFKPTIQNHISRGTIVPGFITANILLGTLLASGHTTFLIDGFPRNTENWDSWNAVVQHNEQKIDSTRAIHYIWNDEDLERRIAERQRSDDTSEAFFRRMQVYKEDSIPLLKKYEKVLEWETNAPIEEVDKILIPAFQKFMEGKDE